MFVNGFQGLQTQQCPVTSEWEDTSWAPQCPVPGYHQPQNMHNYLRSQVYPFRDPSVQCYGGAGFYQRHYMPQICHVPVPRQELPPLVPDLPCHQSRQQWDYNSMCYNVDGQPCQYTGVVDLEDFMNNEKRKEKSRVAARCRRTKEVQIFSEMTAALPAKKEEVDQLDKASVMRLAISYLKVRDVVTLLPETPNPEPQLKTPEHLEDVSTELSYMKALDGFVLVLSQQGDIVYCSENISEHLGVTQMEIMGQSIYEFSHPCEHEDVRDALRTGAGAAGAGAAAAAGGRREMFLRLKCTLTGKGRNVHLKSASYKVIHVTGHMLTPEKRTSNMDEKEAGADKFAKNGTLVAVGRPIPHPSNIEIPLDSNTFLSKHSLDMKFSYADDSLLNTLGFEPDELVGKSLFDYHHAADSAVLALQFKSLFSKGQCETGQYRFLAKRGGYSWVQTQATMIMDKQQKPVSVVCVNYVVSGIECKDEVFAAHQLQHADLKPAVSVPESVPPLDVPNGAIVSIVPPDEERPKPVTSLIFAKRNKAMNKGFLVFSQNEGTMLKDEPEDLTHLAPSDGAACIPLENNPFDTSMFDEFILGDNYCSLLGDDLASGSPVDSLAGDLLMSSPDTQETDSSCEQSSLLTEISLDAFDAEEVDVGKSPFIPMSDELPLLEPAVMWGALPENVSLARPQPSEQASSPAPALQRLLVAPPTGPPPHDLITSIYSDQGLIPNRSVSNWDTGVKRVLKQDEEPSAKRSKRSPSPSQPRQQSSVLFNLLPEEQRQPQQSPVQIPQANLEPNYQHIRNATKSSLQILDKNAPLPPLSTIRNIQISTKSVSLGPSNPILLQGNLNESNMSPLTVNVDTVRYSVPGKTFSPAPAERLLSPYSTPNSLSPAKYPYSPGTRLSPSGILQSASDPYLTNKFHGSPNFPLPPHLDTVVSNVEMTSSDFWSDTDMIQDTSDLLSALDEVKLY